MKRNLISSTFSVVLLLIATALPAKAIFMINASEVGGNVVFTGSGSVDLSAWTFNNNSSGGSGIIPNLGIAAFAVTSADVYTSPVNFAGPAQFGSGGVTLASSVSGDDFSLQIFSGPVLGVPMGYMSGDPLSSSMTFNSTNFSMLGVTPNTTFVWTWGDANMGTADSVVLNFGPAAVPETGSTLLLLGMVVVGYGARRLWT